MLNEVAQLDNSCKSNCWGWGVHLSNLVGELGLGLAQDAGLGVVVALPCEVAG